MTPYSLFAGVLGALLFVSVAAHADGLYDMNRLITAGDKADTQLKKAQPAPQGDKYAIRLTPDRTKILRLRENAASVIVANPAHASVILDTPQLLILMPREPGTTSFTVLDKEGKVLMERNIIVSAAQPQYVRIRRVCGDSNNCAPSNYYYCPDGCFEVTPVVNENTGSIPEVEGGAGAIPAPAAAPADPMVIEETEGPMIVNDPEDQDMPQDAPEDEAEMPATAPADEPEGE